MHVSVYGILSQFNLQVVRERVPDSVLEVIDLLICEAAVHGAVGNAVAVRGLLLLGIGKIVYELYRLDKVPGNAAHHLTQIVFCEAVLRQPEAHILHRTDHTCFELEDEME